MTRRSLLWIGFVGLNIAFAVVLILFVSRSGTRTPVQPPSILPQSAQSQPTNRPLSGLAQPQTSPPTNATLPSAISNPPPAVTASTPPSNQVAQLPFKPGKIYDWRDVEGTQYKGYLDGLRAAGAPEKIIRHIVFTDANDLFNQRRLEAAVTNDFKWWGTDNQLTAGGYNPEYQNRMQTLVEERRELLTRLIGTNWEVEDKTPSLANHTVALTGPVLGALPPETYLGVQEICARSVARHQDYQMSRFNEGQPTSPVELAKLRDQTRKDLSLVLDNLQLEEFLLRFSHNSSKLRQDLRGLNLGPEEFRKIFRVTDAIDHQIQLEYGSEEALSAKQREQLLRQREQAIAGVLGQDRYERLILSRDPNYRQAQMLVMQSGAPDGATQPLYALIKANSLKRQEIQASNTLTPEQKRAALLQINQEHIRAQQRILQTGKADP